MKMAGTDWNQYRDMLSTRKEYMLAQPHKDVYLTSEDGLRLHAVYFPGDGTSDKAVICLHGYTSEGMKDNIGLSDYYLKRGYVFCVTCCILNSYFNRKFTISFNIYWLWM